MQKRTHRLRLTGFLVGVLILVLGLVTLFCPASDARAAVQSTWRNAHAAGGYAFRADIVQHVVPVATVTSNQRTIATFASTPRPRAITFDPISNKIYWTEASKIRRSNLDGSSQEDVVVGLNSATDVVVDGTANKLYSRTTNGQAGIIWSKDLTSGNPVNLRSTVSFAGGLALDAERGLLYFGDARSVTPLQGHAVTRMNIDGSGAEDVINGIALGPNAVTLDVRNDRLYW